MQSEYDNLYNVLNLEYSLLGYLVRVCRIFLETVLSFFSLQDTQAVSVWYLFSSKKVASVDDWLLLTTIIDFIAQKCYFGLLPYQKEWYLGFEDIF